MKKYEFTGETKVVFGKTLRRIKAVVKFGIVEVGELGGWIEKEDNLSHSGNARVSDDAEVSSNAWVSDDAKVFRTTHLLVVGPIGRGSEIMEAVELTQDFKAKDELIEDLIHDAYDSISLSNESEVRKYNAFLDEVKETCRQMRI